MGRLLEALKRADPLPTPPAALPAQPSAPAEEVPYIEWGPHKSMEASPSVLAAPGPGARPPRVPDETAVALVAPPTGVAFRAAPAARRGAELAPELIAFHDPQHAVSAQYRELLRALLAGRPADRPQALLFTTARPGSDTTTTVLNIAITAARLGRRRVAVIDANTAAPAVAAALGLAEQPGWREVLAGAAPLDEALRETAQPDLVALTAGVTAPSGGVRFLAETERSLLRQLRQRFDLVFVDAPPWDARPETPNLAEACDAVYVVAPPAEADGPATDELFRRVAECGAALGGCVVAGR
jgi:Mrp family chromosome partitioning ATPase